MKPKNQGHAPTPDWSTLGALRAPVTLALTIAAIAVRTLYALWAELPYRDGQLYDELAYSLVRHMGYHAVGDGGLPAKAPGYPFFLAAVYGAVGEHHGAVLVLQHALDLLSAILVLDLARRFGMRRGVAIGAYAIALFNPFTMVYATMILSETLATFLVTLATWLLVRTADEYRNRGRHEWSSLIAMGVALSLAALTRPALAPLGAVLLGVPLFGRLVPWRRWIAWSSVAALAFIFTWLPWGVRNIGVTHRFIPYHSAEAGTGGYTRWVSTWATDMQDVYFAYFDQPPRPPPKAFHGETDRATIQSLIASRASLPPPADPIRSAEIDAEFRAIGDEYALAHPVDFLLVKPSIRSLTMWFTSNSTFLAQGNVRMDSLRGALRTNPLGVLAKVLGLVLSSLFPLLAIAGWWFTRRRAGSIALVPVVVGAFCTIVVQLVIVLRPNYQIMMEPRYVIESFPGLTPFVAAGAATLLLRVASAVRQRGPRSASTLSTL